MVWKVVNNSDAGDATHFGGNDIDKISNLFNAVANIDTVDLNSTTRFRDTRLQLRGSSASNIVTVRTSSISGLSDLVIPNPTGSTSQTMLTSNNSITVVNKTIPAWDNSLLGVMHRPSVKKHGQIPCGAVTGGGSGVGLLYGFIDMPGLPTRGVSASNGAHWVYTTPVDTANVPTGIRVPARWAMKEWGLYFRAKVRAATTTNTRLYVGLSFDTQIPATATPIDNNESAVLLGWRDSTQDTNIQVFRNSGTSTSSSTPSVVDTGVARGTSARQYEIWFYNPTTCRVRILDASGTTVDYSQDFTTNLPNDTMSPSVVYASTTAAAKNLEVYFVEMEEDV